MKTEDIVKMAEGFKEIGDAIKNEEVSITEMREGLEGVKEEIMASLETVKNVMENDTLIDIQSVGVRETVLAEIENYDKKEHKKDLKTVLALTAALDEEIGEKVFLPFMIYVIEKTAEILKDIQPDITKNITKILTKFLAKRNINE